MKIQTEEEV